MKKFYFLALAAAVGLSASAQQVKSRAAMAAGISQETVDGVTTVKYTITGSTATAANLLLMQNGTVVKTIPLTDIKQGVQSIVLDLSDVPEGSYNYAIEVTSNVAGSAPKQVYTKAIYTSPYVYAGTNNGTRTGITFFNDPESPFFGQAIVVNNAPAGKSPGIDIIGADGKITNYQKDTLLPLASSHVGAFVRHDKVLISSWSDGGSGIYLFDPATPEKAPVQLFAGSRDSNGLFTYQGKPVGGSVGGMAVSLDGTKLYTFDEEVNANTPGMYVLGDGELSAGCIKEGPSWVSEAIKTHADNPGAPDYPITTSASVGTAVCPDGMMIGVNRWSNGNQYPGFIFWNPDKDATVFFGSADFCKSAGSGVGFNSDYSLFARMGYTGNDDAITIHEVKWKTVAGMRIPEFGDAIYSIPSSTTFGQICFDAADNLYISNNKQGTATPYQYAVYALPGKRTVKTPAKAADLIEVAAAGVSDIVVDGAEVTPVYYNLQGVKVANPEHGIFIEVRGTKATKVVK